LRTGGVRSHFLLDQQLESCFTRSQLDPGRCSSVLHFEPIHQARTDRSCEATIVTSLQATDRECGPRGWAWSRTQAFVAVEYFFKSPSDLHERLVIVASPVLATANTAVAAVDRAERARRQRHSTGIPDWRAERCRAHARHSPRRSDLARGD
jgi:hypothetical protein